MRPASITRIRSQDEHGRQPMRDHQRGAIAPSAARARPCTSVSLSASSEEVASSSSSSGASRRIARAIAMRWRWPPESVTPRSPDRGVELLRQAVDELGARARARRRARPRRRSPPAGRNGCCRRSRQRRSTASCGTSAMRWRSASGSTSVSGTPSNVTTPVTRIVEPQDEVEDRALAGARRADDRDLLAAPDAKRHAVEHERCPAASDRRSEHPRRRPRRATAAAARSGAPGDTIAGGTLQDFEQPLGGAGRLRELAPDLRQLAEPGGGEHRVEHELGQPPRRHLPVQHVLGADPQHHDHAREHEKDGDRREDRARPGRVARGVERALDRRARSGPRASCSLVKACSTRTAPINSEA